MKESRRKFKDPLIFLGLLIAVPSFIYYISMNFGDQRVHIERKQWNPAEAADQGLDPKQLQKAAEYIETRLPLARGMIIIRNGKTVHEKYYWKGGPQEKDYLHSLNASILHTLVGIAIDRQMLSGTTQPLSDFFPDYFSAGQEQNRLSLTVADLLRVKAELIWGDDPPGYWDLFYAGDMIEAAIRAVMAENGIQHPAASFAANFLLSEIIRTVAAMNVFDFADKYLFQPMGIGTLAELKDQKELMNPFIGFRLTALDLAKFGYLVMNEGAWQDRQLIPSGWLREIRAELGPGLGDNSWGGWQRVIIDDAESYMAKGEGGQFLVLVPEFDMLVAVSSKSKFPLSVNSGYDQLFQLILASAREDLLPDAPAESNTFYEEERPYYAPNFVYATEVPDDIRQFFYDFAQDIATEDINRIIYHYAKGYENGDDTFRSMYKHWRTMFAGGTGELEFVQIEKLRLDGNRAYLRGTVKYSYANMNEGSIGWFPLENLIRLRGRWLWLGAPDYGAILDRGEYFDAELPADLEQFIDDCGPAFTGAVSADKTECFSADFIHNSMRQPQIKELLKSFWANGGKMKLHVTRMEQDGGKALLEGYIADSLIGAVRLPAGMVIVNEGGRWKLAGNGVGGK